MAYTFAKVGFLLEIGHATSASSKIESTWINHQNDAGYAPETCEGCEKWCALHTLHPTDICTGKSSVWNHTLSGGGWAVQRTAAHLRVANVGHAL